MRRGTGPCCGQVSLFVGSGAAAAAAAAAFCRVVCGRRRGREGGLISLNLPSRGVLVRSGWLQFGCYLVLGGEFMGGWISRVLRCLVAGGWIWGEGNSALVSLLLRAAALPSWHWQRSTPGSGAGETSVFSPSRFALWGV